MPSTRFSLVVETTRGTTPATPVYYIIPVIPASSSVEPVRNNVISAVNQAPGMGGAVIGGTQSGVCKLGMPIAKESAYEKLLENALSGTFGSFVASAAITGTFAAGLTFTRAAGNFLTDTITNRLRVGDKVAATGTANQGTTLNGAVASTSSTTITVTATSMLPSTGAVKIDSEWISYTGKTSTTLTGCTRGAFGTTAAIHTDTTAVSPIKTITDITALVLTFSETCASEVAISTTFTTRKKQLFCGVTRNSLSIERSHPDTAVAIVDNIVGAECNQMQHTLPAAGETVANFDIVGNDVVAGAVAGATYTAAAGNSPMSGTVAGTIVRIADAAATTCFPTFQFTLNSNRAPKFGLGSNAACLVESGNQDVTGSFTAYLVDRTFIDYSINGTRFELEVLVRDQNRFDGYRFIFPQAAIVTNPTGVDGQTVTDTPNFRAEFKADAGTNFLIEAIFGS